MGPDFSVFVEAAMSVLNLGVLGVVFQLFVTGKLHSDREMTQVLSDLATERAAHEHTREALRIANARGESGAMAAEIVARAFEGAHLRQQGGEHPHVQAVEP